MNIDNIKQFINDWSARDSEKSDALVDEAFKCYEKETTVPQYVALGKKQL